MILPDANLLVAFTWENHEHQAAAVSFFQQHPKVATCPLTELALVRVWMQKHSRSPWQNDSQKSQSG
jgi:predicted nucleic acid-binding protein